MSAFRPLALLLTLVLASCGSSTGKRETPGVMSQQMRNRLTKPDMSRRSPFEKAMQANLGDKSKSGTGGWLTKQKYLTQEFSGAKAFGKTDKFKTPEFNSGKDANKLGSQQFAQADKAADAADDRFATNKSRFGDQALRDGDKAFSGADDAFKTSANRDALRSQEKNEGPEFIVLDQQQKGPAYSEAQVKRLLGRQ